MSTNFLKMINLMIERYNSNLNFPENVNFRIFLV